MRNFNLLLLFIYILLLNSCCTKKECDGAIGSIELKNFTEQEVDSIIVRSYQKNSNFTILSDSFFTSGIHTASDTEMLLIGFPNGISFDLEYKIDVLSIGKMYKINGFQIEKKECNSCFPWRGRDYYSVLDKYFLNSVEKQSNGNGIIIDK